MEWKKYISDGLIPAGRVVPVEWERHEAIAEVVAERADRLQGLLSPAGTAHCIRSLLAILRPHHIGGPHFFLAAAATLRPLVLGWFLFFVGDLRVDILNVSGGVAFR